MNLAYLKKLTTFTDTTINIRNHKSDKFDKNKPKRLWPYKYRINAINNKHLNIPRCRINPKKVRLENIHVISWVLLKGLKAHGPWSSQPLKRLGHG